MSRTTRSSDSNELLLTACGGRRASGRSAGGAGAAGGGDRLKVISDGLHWYILDCTALTDAALVSGTATRS